MTPDTLRKKLIEHFACAKLSRALEVNDSTVQELPRLFEVSHFAMQIVLSDASALAHAGRIAAAMKRNLADEGIELEYGITVRAADCQAMTIAAGT
jgi:hypothetical protein